MYSTSLRKKHNQSHLKRMNPFVFICDDESWEIQARTMWPVSASSIRNSCCRHMLHTSLYSTVQVILFSLFNVEQHVRKQRRSVIHINGYRHTGLLDLINNHRSLLGIVFWIRGLDWDFQQVWLAKAHPITIKHDCWLALARRAKQNSLGLHLLFLKFCRLFILLLLLQVLLLITGAEENSVLLITTQLHTNAHQASPSVQWRLQREYDTSTPLCRHHGRLGDHQPGQSKWAVPTPLPPSLPPHQKKTDTDSEAELSRPLA
jgi:hypothetical protein